MNESRQASGLVLPPIGYGTFPLKEQLVDSVPMALRCGYKLIDTSDNYHNEKFIGEGLKRFGEVDIPCVMVSKFSQPLRTGSVARCLAEAEKRLGRKVDVYLLHWPYPFLWRRQWRELEELYLAGRVKAIGVCNFDRQMMEMLLRFARVKPMIDQFERHPMFQQSETADFCRKSGVRIMCYSPLARMDPRLLDNPVLKDIAEAHGRSVGQVILRWNIERGDVPIPASRSQCHISENFSVFDFSLSKEELSCIDALEAGARVRFDPQRRFGLKMKLQFAWRAFKLAVKDVLTALHVVRVLDFSNEPGDVCTRF